MAGPFLFRSPINIPQDDVDTNQQPNPFQLFPQYPTTVTNNNEQQSETPAVCPPEQTVFFNMNNQPQPQQPISEEMSLLRKQLAERDAQITELKNQLDIVKNEKHLALNAIELKEAEIGSLNIKYQENQEKYENVVLDRDIEIEKLQDEVMETKSEVEQVKINMGRQNEGLCHRIQDLENENNRLKIEKETCAELIQRCVKY